MRKIIFVICYLACSWSYAQEEPFHNGINIESVCAVNCIYSIIKNPIVYDVDDVEHWQMINAELAIKSNGNYIATGDLSISGTELAAILNFKLLFYDDTDQLVKEVESGEFEFYSEHGFAEPFVFSGQVSQAEADRIKYLYFEVVSSRIVPYYEISSDCYVACKNHELNEALKAFKKSK